MKNALKNSKALFTFAILAAIVFTTASFGGSNSDTFRLKQAQAALTVECDCAFWGGNNNCLANNNGAQCAADGTAQCQLTNANCGGTNQTL